MPPKTENKVNILNDIDNTIHYISDCIVNKKDISFGSSTTETIKALAELVSARASLDKY